MVENQLLHYPGIYLWVPGSKMRQEYPGIWVTRVSGGYTLGSTPIPHILDFIIALFFPFLMHCVGGMGNCMFEEKKKLPAFFSGAHVHITALTMQFKVARGLNIF